MINVTKSFLPPQSEYQAILKTAWDNGWMTNRGVLVQALENKLSKFLEVPHILAMTNGTLPMQIAIKAFGLSGEIITTPFSYVATTSCIVWEGCTPVFVDIHPEYLTIDETKIEAAITPKTTAILATHVFGNPCAVEEIEKIANKHNLKIIYDAAHCFGVTYKGQSVFNYGDISTCSFHATKLFHTGEGGALFTKDKALQKKVFSMHNFGHKGHENFQGIGINAKMSEPQAALGLAILPYMDEVLTKRHAIVERYKEGLKDTSIQFLKLRKHTHWNSSYFPIIFKNERQLKEVKNVLETKSVFTRRYFYPSLHKLPYVNTGSFPITETISSTILCLPLFHDLSEKDQEMIIFLIMSAL